MRDMKEGWKMYVFSSIISKFVFYPWNWFPASLFVISLELVSCIIVWVAPQKNVHYQTYFVTLFLIGQEGLIFYY